MLNGMKHAEMMSILHANKENVGCMFGYYYGLCMQSGNPITTISQFFSSLVMHQCSL